MNMFVLENNNKVNHAHAGFKDNTSLAAKGALAQRLQRRTACKTQHGHQGAPKWPTGLERGLTLDFWVLPSTFAK